MIKVGDVVGASPQSLQALVERLDPKRLKALDDKYGKKE